MGQLITILLVLFIGTENPQLVKLTTDKEFKLDGFTVRDSYALNEKERFVIASQKTTDKGDIEGLRLIYIKENKIEFTSPDVGESYIYRPTFYKFQDNSFLIVCEQGFEYSLGVDVFEFKEGRILKIGNIDVASTVDNNPTSIVPSMTIEKKYGDQYNFTFKGQTVINPGGREETKIDGGLIQGIYIKETGKISLMIKSK
jgi:hypothetical protein